MTPNFKTVITCFNSIKVQLELYPLLFPDGASLFQFHKGSIRTICRRAATASRLTAFQFHKGSIRTPVAKYKLVPYPSFNSIKVQLERFRLPARANAHYGFNSIKVQLEHYFTGAHTRPLAVFQFHKGSIRTCVAVKWAIWYFPSFNSIKVQLELALY